MCADLRQTLLTGGIAEPSSTQKGKGKRKARPEGDTPDDAEQVEEDTGEGSSELGAGSVVLVSSGVIVTHAVLSKHRSPQSGRSTHITKSGRR